MFGNLGYAEVIIICFLALLLFGAKRLPEIGASLGKSIRMFKKSVKDLQEELPSQEDIESYEEPPRTTTTSSRSTTGTGSTRPQEPPVDRNED